MSNAARQLQPAGKNKWMRVDAAREYLGFRNIRSIYHLVQTKKLPVHRVGNLLFFSADELDAFLMEH